MIKNYDPNHDYEHHWKVKLQQWEHTLEIDLIVGGNMKGLDTLRYALENYYEDHEPMVLILHDDHGNTLECEIENEEEFYKMVVGAQLIKVVKKDCYS